MKLSHHMWITSLTQKTHTLDVMVEAGHSDKSIEFPVSREMAREIHIGQRILVTIDTDEKAGA